MTEKTNPYHEIAGFLGEFTNDPLGFVYACFPWGQDELKGQEGPDGWQKAYLDEVGRKLREKAGEEDQIVREAVASGHGIGKRLANSLIVEGFSGPIQWKDVREGTVLIGSDGKPTIVVASSEDVVRPIYKITFDDGSYTYADAEHTWTVRGRQERRTGIGWVNLTTQQLLDRGVTRSNGRTTARQFEIPTVSAVQFPEKVLPLHPYLMGVYLGDGTHGNSSFPTADLEIVERLEALGYSCSVKHYTNNAVNVTVSGLHKIIKKSEISGLRAWEKFIPKEYKYGSVEQREELLRGLMDTDGTADKAGRTIFTSTSKRLAEDVLWVVRSLGGKGRLGKAKPRGYKDQTGKFIKCRDSYDVCFVLPDGFKYFYIDRKQERVAKTHQSRYLSRWIDSIEYSHEEDGHCVQVDAPDSLYCANDFILTHNSALVSWLILWAISTRPGTKIVVTANTERQLLTKTVPEVAKWHRLFIGKALFTMTATALYSADEGHERTWRCDFMPWSVNNADAFAGLHNQDGRILLVFDEASGIDRKIWEVAEGALTDKHTQIIWAVFGNPTRPEGKFFECFHTHRALWNTRKIDSRTVKITNQQQLQSWVDTYGEDSDFVRVRVRGEFPRHGENQFISPDLVSKARQIIIPKPQYANISPVIGVDVARMGNDASIILVRQGDKVHPAQKFNQIDTMELAGKVFDTYSKYGRMGAICIDAVGVGAGLFDFLRSRGLPVIEVQSASKATDFKTYANKRAELYGKVKEWLEQGGALPEDPDLEEQLSCFSYSFNNRLQILLESKDDIKKRIGKSPDVSDALAYTFAYEEAVRLAHMTRAKPIKRVQW